jgi:threonine dehydrogenase-like Zn-dependent dehydrogenase
VDGLDANRLVLDGLTVRGIRHGLDHYPEALALFERGVLRAAPLVAAVLPLSRSAEAFARFEHGPRRAPKILLALD